MSNSTPKGGVYQITNKITKVVYIGGSTNVKRRISDHKRDLRKNQHSNKHLQNSYNKHGEKNFLFDVLFWSDDLNDLLAWEQFWIDASQAATSNQGYNIAPIAGRTTGYRHTEEFKNEQSERVRKFWENPEYKKNFQDKMKAIWQTQEFRDFILPILNTSRGQAKDKISKTLKIYYQDTSERLRLSNQARQQWQNLEFVTKIRSAHKRYVESSVQERSEAMKEKWKDDEFREKMTEIRKAQVTTEVRQKFSDILKERWKNPEYRNSRIEKIRLSHSDQLFKTLQQIKASKYLYTLVSPNGDTHEVFSLHSFCKEYKISESAMNSVTRGIYKQCNGWTGTRRLLTKEEKDLIITKIQSEYNGDRTVMTSKG